MFHAMGTFEGWVPQVYLDEVCPEPRETPAIVIQADSAAQARAFVAINGRVTQVSTQQRFKAALAAGDPDAAKLKAVGDAAGVAIAGGNSAACNLQPGETVALEAIRRAMTRYGHDLTRLALACIVASSQGAVGYLRAMTIRAVATALASDPAFQEDEARCIAAFDELDLEAARKTTFAQAEGNSGAVALDLFTATIAAHLAERLGTREAA